MKRSTYIILLISIACVCMLVFRLVQPKPAKGTKGSPVSERLKSSTVESARAIFAKAHVTIPAGSFPKVEYDSQGNITVEFMHLHPPQNGERRGDNLGFVRFDPDTLKPIEILGPGP